MRTGKTTVKGSTQNPAKLVPFTATSTEESRQLSAEDVARCDELCKDLSSCIDVLYELSRSRRAIQDGSYPMSGITPSQPGAAPEKLTLPPPTSKMLFSNRSFSSSGETLVNPSRVSTEKTLVVADLPPKLDRKDLVLPQEPPPAYGTHGNHAVRMIGHLKRTSPVSVSFTSAGQQQDVQPVMVEYAFFDPTYRETGVRLPPTEKLDALINYFARSNAAQEQLGGVLPCAGWFEDLDYSRYGIVYELPRGVRTANPGGRPRDLRPTSLVSILQSASKTSAASSQPRQIVATVPPLEDRFRMAYNILQALSRMNEDSNLIHRNVCSNNVLFFSKESGRSVDTEASATMQYELAEPFIVGFDLFTEYNVTPAEDPLQHRQVNLYQHPDAFRRTATYRAEYDAYSLGLILLEIGLWIPLSDLWKTKYSLADFRSRLEAIWVKKLAAKVGSTYMNVVKDLLSAANSKRSATSAISEAKSRLRQIYSRSLGRLRRCCMIDEAEPLDLSPSESMHNSALESMVRQGALLEREQVINRWTEKMQFSEEPANSMPASTTTSEPLPAQYRYPHTLPVAIEEASEDSLSRHASTASNSRAGILSRLNSGLQMQLSKDGADDDAKRTGPIAYQSAAQTIQRAWRSRRDTPSFREYKRKVTLIQKLWRRRTFSKTDTSSSSGDMSASGVYASSEYLSGQRSDLRPSTAATTTIQITPHVSAPRKKIRIHPQKLAPAQVAQWHNILLPRLEKIVGRALKDSPETCSIDLLCVGDTPARAKPTIFVTCTSTGRVKTALSRRFEYDHASYDLKVRRGDIRRSKSHSATRRVREAHRSMAIPTASSRESGSTIPLNPFHQKRPICGASIGAYADAQHLPPVSFGGVVAVDAGKGLQLYGMTVHHLLDSPSDEEGEEDDDPSESGYFEDSDDSQTSPGATRSSAAGGSSWLASMGAAPGLELEDSSLHSAYLEISDDSSVASDADAPELDYSSDEDVEASVIVSHASTEGDLVGILPGDATQDPVYVTQPAIDDVANGFFPDMSDRDEDHLSSHKLGVVYASSGIRRWQRGGIAHEVDWALMKLDDDRLQPINVVQGGRKYLKQRDQGSPLLDGTASHRPNSQGTGNSLPNPFLEAIEARRETLHPKLVEPVSRSPTFSASDDEYPTDIVPADELGSLHVHSFGRTSGLQEGVIGDAMSSVRIYRRRSFSRSWHVLGGFGMGGDSGAWILDNDTGRVCGHVLAFAERNHMAYICPLEVMFEDMLRVLNAHSIWLPGGEAAAIRSDFRRRDTVETDATAGAEPEDESDDLPFDLNELGIEDTDTDERPGGVVLRTSPVRGAGRSSLAPREHDRERLMYAPGSVLSISRGETLVGGEREPQRVLV